MNETLLDRAHKNYIKAVYIFNCDDGDEFNLNLSGYLLQQATELCLKHVLELTGIKYPLKHEIEMLLQVIPQNQQYMFKSIDIFAPVISTWESKTRYIKNYYLARKTITDIMPLVKETLDNITNYYSNPINKLNCELAGLNETYGVNE